ncbi:MAG: YidH family protein [Allosphingosinicella sp.]|uniref:YidH family protein n=1 Tax=Allosphingosinicella sp. TaxID=2823234 RepID=UPI003941BD08
MTDQQQDQIGKSGRDRDDKDRDSMAEDRTDLAEDRTVLANERTFAGWMRTGMAAVGIGLGFNALFQMMEPAWVAKAIATVFLFIGIFVFLAAERRACSVLSRLDTHQVKSFKAVNLRLITYALVAATTALVAALWLLELRPDNGA